MEDINRLIVFLLLLGVFFALYKYKYLIFEDKDKDKSKDKDNKKDACITADNISQISLETIKNNNQKIITTC